MQHTLLESVSFDGIGLHSGKPAKLTLVPAPADHGIVFERVDLPQGTNKIPARYDHVTDTRLCTLLSNEDGAYVSTVEHLMAALSGLGVNNILAQTDGSEVPILDGSSIEFVAGILDAGLAEQGAPLRAIKILKTVQIQFDDVTATLKPADALSIDFSIDFSEEVIGQQDKILAMANGAFIRELSDSRTFCRLAEVDYLKSNGLALGGSLENAIVVDGEKVMNPEGFRHEDECVRHKMLDALGDLYMAGAPILGSYIGERAGHRATNELLRALFADPEAWEYVTCDAQIATRLPGSDLKPSDMGLIKAA